MVQYLAQIKSPLSIDIEGPSASTYEGPITIAGICDKPGRAIALNPEDPYFYEALKTDEIIGADYARYDAWVRYLILIHQTTYSTRQVSGLILQSKDTGKQRKTTEMMSPSSA